MLQLLVPIALVGLLVWAVPIVIHVWSRGRPETVRVGSIRWLEQAEPRRPRRLKLTQWPLLLVRLLLLGLLVLLLARPVWTQATQDDPAPQSWVLVHPAVMSDTTVSAWWTRLDSLANRGASVRWLQPGLKPADLAARDMASVQNYGAAVPDAWSLLMEADAQLPPGSDITVVSPPWRALFRGMRPALRADVTWVSAGTKGTNRWVESARRVGTDSLIASTGVSTPTGTTVERMVMTQAGAQLQRADGAPASLTLSSDEATLQIAQGDAWASDNRVRIAPPVDTLRALVVHDEARSDDGRYMAIGLRTAARYAYVPLDLQQRNGDITPDDLEGRDLLVWLRAVPVPDSLWAHLTRSAYVIEDADAEVQPVSGFVVGIPGAHESIPLTQRAYAGSPAESSEGADDAARYITHWVDAQGIPLLTERQRDGRTHLRFASRFHPTTTPLVFDEAFTAWLLDRIEGLRPVARGASGEQNRARDVHTLVHDRRIVPAAQYQPNARADTVQVRATSSEPQRASVHIWVWCAALICFVAERWLSSRQAAA